MNINKLNKNNNEITKAGITIHLDQTEERKEPFDITLYIKKSNDNKEAINPDDENSVTTTGKLSFKIGKVGLIELFAENISLIDYDLIKQEDII